MHATLSIGRALPGGAVEADGYVGGDWIKRRGSLNGNAAQELGYFDAGKNDSRKQLSFALQSAPISTDSGRTPEEYAIESGAYDAPFVERPAPRARESDMRSGSLGKFLLCVVMAGLLMPATALAGGGTKNMPAAYKLDGAWIARVVGTLGQWSYVLSPDPSGRTATGHGSIEVGFATGELSADYTSPLLVAVKMTGPDTAVFNSVWYGVRRLHDSTYSAEIVYIGVNKGTTHFTGPGKAEGMHNLAYYLPSQDADGDGLPDPGQTPIASVQFVTEEVRLPMP